MNQPNPAANFTFWDFLVDVIPGIVGLLLAGSVLPRSYVLDQLTVVPKPGVVGLFVLLVVGYVVGWVVQSCSRRVDAHIMSLRDNDGLMADYYEEAVAARDDGEWPLWRRYVESSQVFFHHDGADHYDDIADSFDSDALKHLTQSYVLDNDIGRMYRFKILHVFMRSLYFLFGLGAAVHLLLAALQFGPGWGYVPALGTLESLGLAAFLLVGCWETYDMRKYLEQSMLKSMMTDFYTAELIE